MSYIIEHTRLGFCWLDIVALIVLLVVVIWFMVIRHDMKIEEKDLDLRGRYGGHRTSYLNKIRRGCAGICASSSKFRAFVIACTGKCHVL